MPFRRSKLFVPVLVIAAAFAAGCAQKNAIVDPAFTLPEGRLSEMVRLVTWPSRDGTSLVYAPLNNETTRIDDLQLDTVITYPSPTPGAVRMNIIDGTGSSSFELFRRSAGGGFSRLRAYELQPLRKWLDGHWSLTDHTDLQPGAGAEYVARGVVAGTVTSESPLSNISTPQATGDVPATLTFDISGSDSLQRFSWTADPAASGYFLEVFPLAALSTRADRIASSEPAPFLSVRLRDYITAYVPATPQPSVRLTPGGVAPAVSTDGAIVMANQSLAPFAFYVVRVTAFDPQGRVINRLRPEWPVSYDFIALEDPDLPEGAYEALPVGGPVMVYGPTPPASRSRPADSGPGWRFATNR